MRLIDADALMAECEEELKDESLWHDEDTTKDYAEGSDDGKRIIMNIIDSAPSIDICYCRECKYASDDGTYGCMCEHFNDTSDAYHRMWSDDFCSYGERRE